MNANGAALQGSRWVVCILCFVYVYDYFVFFVINDPLRGFFQTVASSNNISLFFPETKAIESGKNNEMLLLLATVWKKPLSGSLITKNTK